MSQDYFPIKLKEFTDKDISWTQVVDETQVYLENYEDAVANGSIQDINEQQHQYRFLTKNISQNDKILITYPSDEIIFQYIVSEKDIVKTSLYQTCKNICISATKQSKKDFLFEVIQLKNKSCVFKITMNFEDIFADEIRISIPKYYTILDRFIGSDNYNQFRGISLNDICLLGQPNLSIINDMIKIDNKYYDVIEKFKFDEKTILRLNDNAGLTKISNCTIYQEKQETYLSLTPINFLSLNSILKSYIPYEQDKYSFELKDNFSGNQLFDEAIIEFDKQTELPNHQYVDENKTELIDIDTVTINDYNLENCLNMIFSSVGQTAYLTPNILNIDKKFYQNNGCLDSNKLNSDLLRFNWFLIDGRCPDYLQNDIRSLRFFNSNNNEKPQITSRLIKINDDFCETVFLGVKYTLPIKYIDYQFATYLCSNNREDIVLNYKFEVNDINKTLYLSINKYFDFSDLIRGGNEENASLIDLSFFYSTNNSFNKCSTYTADFKSSSLKLCADFERDEPPIYFESIPLRDWKYSVDGHQYLALRLGKISEDKINDFRLLFRIGEDGIFNVYSKTTINGNTYEYISMSVTVKNIIDVKETYLWCDDIKIKFFAETEFVELQRNIGDNNVEILTVLRSDLIPNRGDSNIFNNIFNHINTTDLSEYIKLTQNEITVKQFYFEINKTITKNSFGQKTIYKNVFRFNENIFIDKLATDAEVISQFDSNEPYLLTNINPNETFVSKSKVSLFDKNQTWFMIKALFKNNVRFKNSSKELIRKYFNKLMVHNLVDFCEINSIPIRNMFNIENNFINLSVNDINRNIVIWKNSDKFSATLINRFNGIYFPYMEKIKNPIDFQLSIFNKTNSFFNIYDKNFGGLNISATGIWNEVQGNLISSLFCKSVDIKIETNFVEIINYRDLFKSNLNIDDLIITNNNSTYIQKIDKNIDEYILNNYCDYILSKFYYLDSVINENDKRLSYYLNDKNSNELFFNIQQDYNKLIFIFKRK